MEDKMGKVSCKWCGIKFGNVIAMSNSSCFKSPSKRHELYEGSEKSQYVCKYCGIKFPNLVAMANSGCSKSPSKRHEPAL